jgi:hypothetical protein
MRRLRRGSALIAALVFSLALCCLAIAPQHALGFYKAHNSLQFQPQRSVLGRRMPFLLRIRGGAGEQEGNQSIGLGARMIGLADEAGALGFDIGAAMKSHQFPGGSALHSTMSQQAAEQTLQRMLELCQKAMDDCYDR